MVRVKKVVAFQQSPAAPRAGEGRPTLKSSQVVQVGGGIFGTVVEAG